MVIAIFDTETTSLTKPFCYNIGYVIIDTDTGETLVSHDFVVEQIWHNLELFSSAYYAEKRQIYVKRMRSRQAKMDKFGYICQKMIKEFDFYGVTCAYAYNSPFDEKVFDFNCEWYKCSNPFDTVPIFDIRGVAHQFVCQSAEFKEFCDNNEYYTENGNYSTTAETLYRYIAENTDFEEEHTALADSEIEWKILEYCVNVLKAKLAKEYQVLHTIPRDVEKTLEIVTNGNEIQKFPYRKKIVRKDKIFLYK